MQIKLQESDFNNVSLDTTWVKTGATVPSLISIQDFSSDKKKCVGVWKWIK